MANRRPWTVDEEMALEHLAGKYTMEHLAKRFGRGKSSIASKMRDLKISNRVAGMSLPEIAKEYNCPLIRVRQMIETGKLRATRKTKGSAWSVEPEDIGPEQIAILKLPRKSWSGLEKQVHPRKVYSRMEIDKSRWTLPQDAKKEPYGYSCRFASGHGFTGKIFYVAAGHATSLKYHTQKRGSFCLLQGRCHIVIGKKKHEMEIGMGYFIQSNVRHRLVAIGNCIVIETSTPEVGQTFRIADLYGRELTSFETAHAK